MSCIIKNADVKRYKAQLPSVGHFYEWEKRASTRHRLKSAVGFDVTLKVTRRKGKRYDIYASVIEDELGNSHVDIEIVHDPTRRDHLPQLHAELCGSIRHEIEHISDEGALSMGAPKQRSFVPLLPNEGKIVHTINKRAKLLSDLYGGRDKWGEEETARLQRAIDGDLISYLTCYEEVTPIVQGIYFEAKKLRSPVNAVLRRYLDRLFRLDLLTEDTYDEAYDHLIGWTKMMLPNAIVTD